MSPANLSKRRKRKRTNMYSILQQFEQAKKAHLTEFESKNSNKNSDGCLSHIYHYPKALFRLLDYFSISPPLMQL